jgi:hypothetical protein
MTKVLYRSSAGTTWTAELINELLGPNQVEIHIDGDPFPVVVNREQVEEIMPTATRNPSARELREEAKSLGIQDWRDMGRAELKAAVEAARTAENGKPTRRKKTTTKKATTKRATRPKPEDGPIEAPHSKVKRAGKKATAKKAVGKKTAAKKATKKAATKKATTKKATVKKATAKRQPSRREAVQRRPVARGRVQKLPLNHRAGRMSAEEREAISRTDNPFRPGTNIWYITEELLKGGKRSTMVKRLKDKLEFTPRVRKSKDFDLDAEIDRRLRIFGYALKNEHGYSYVLRGRGKDAYLRVYPPGATIEAKDQEYVQAS